MTLYEIDQKILDCIDSETGEIIDLAALDDLEIERNEKIENVACWIKDLKAEASALKEEADKLTARKKAAENKAESLKKYLAYALNGEKFKSTRASISYRKSQSVEVVNESDFVEWAMKNADDLLTYSAPTPNKKAIKQRIENGETIINAHIVENNSIIIK